ncbi:transcription initiation factor TFIID subunit 8 isoform X5 [Paroedura picta]|uniref:transcription initiation factor TFIID subunit 8 isoform X5 n=1 Tax=Paroedura picta TaxID=143630 RepID=UPI004055F029
MLAFFHGAKMADTGTGGPNNSGTRSGGKHSTTPADNYFLARRRTLQVVVSSLLTEAGFESAEKAAVETMTEMIQSYISEIGRSAKSFCEHTARTQPTLSDIVVTLVEMGFNVETLPAYAKRSQRMVITAPPVTNQPVTPKALTAGQNKPHPSHIPSHFPEFPDPHTYIKTPTYREPVQDYQILREKAASQRRDVERALTRFMAKTGETQSLFKDDVSTFPCVATDEVLYETGCLFCETTAFLIISFVKTKNHTETTLDFLSTLAFYYKWMDGLGYPMYSDLFAMWLDWALTCYLEKIT